VKITKETIKDGLCVASVIVGMILAIGAEGADKAGTLSSAKMVVMMTIGLVLMAAPVVVCWLEDRTRTSAQDADPVGENDEERRGAA